MLRDRLERVKDRHPRLKPALRLAPGVVLAGLGLMGAPWAVDQAGRLQVTASLGTSSLQLNLKPPHERLAPGVPVDAPPARDLAATTAFRRLPVIYKVPQTLPWGRPSNFELVIASADLAAARDALAHYPGRPKDASVVLAPQVKARLWSGDEGVRILARDAEVKDVTAAANVHWVWSVTPRTEGDVVLELSLYNVLGKDHEIDGPVYFDRFTVTKPFGQKLRDGVAAWNPVWAALTAALALLAGWAAWLARKLWTRPPPDPPFHFTPRPPPRPKPKPKAKP